MKPPEKTNMESETLDLDVIAVGAHPDDVEIACGATLAKLSNQGYRVGIVDLTDGEPTPTHPVPKFGDRRALAAAAKLGIQHRIQLDLPIAGSLIASRVEWNWQRFFEDIAPK